MMHTNCLSVSLELGAYRCKDNIVMNLGGLECKDVEWIKLAQDMVQ